MSDCFCDATAGGDPAGKRIDRPNKRTLPANAWESFNNQYPVLITCLADPGGNLVAIPDKEANTTTEVYTSIGTGADRVLFLPVPGRWKVRSLGGSIVNVLVLDLPDRISALFYGGVRVHGNVNVTATITPGTFTPLGAVPVTVGVTSGLVLAAGAYKHIWFRNASPGTERITIEGNGGAAVLDQGWTLGPDPTGAGQGDVIAWNHQDSMPLGAFNAIASGAAGKLLIATGT